MRVLMITSDRFSCGVNSYTELLMDALGAFADPDLYVEDISSTVASKDVVLRSDSPDIIHLQFQETLYQGTHLQEWVSAANLLNIPVVITLHDRCVPPSMPFHDIDHVISHTEGIRKLVVKEPEYITVLPLGIPMTTFSVLSFGLGRTDEELVRDVVESIDGAVYEYHNGDETFLPYEDLVRKIRLCDIVVLWYPEAYGTGSSFAARLAIGCRRPLVVNDVSWFQDLPSTSLVQYAQDSEDLKRALRRTKCDMEEHLGDQTMEEVARTHVRIYHGVLEG